MVDRNTAVAIAGPLDGKFAYSIIPLHRSEDNLDVERETFRYQLTVQFFGDFGSIHLESALCIREIPGDLKEPLDESPKGPGTDFSQKGLLTKNMAAGHFS